MKKAFDSASVVWLATLLIGLAFISVGLVNFIIYNAPDNKYEEIGESILKTFNNIDIDVTFDSPEDESK